MIKRFLLLSIATLMLAACGGGGSDAPLFGGNNSEEQVDDGSDVDGGTDEDGTPLSANTYYPLDVYLQGSDYVEKDVFRGLGFEDFIFAQMIAPVNAQTLEPVAAPSIDDYQLIINGEEATKDEHSLMMQKVIGLPVKLRTALVIDMSPSSGDKTEVVAAVKKYITAAQASSDPMIKNQEFTILGFSTTFDWFVKDFTADRVTLDDGLDKLSDDWTKRGNFSALYQSIVAAVGTYIGTGSTDITEVDYLTDGDNILTEGYEVDGKQLQHKMSSSVIVFGAGVDTVGYFDVEAATAALNWQSYLVHEKIVEDDEPTDDAVENESGLDGMQFSGTPLYYVAFGTDKLSDNIRTLSSAIIDAGVTGTLSFEQALITHQVEDVKARSHLDNLYMVRYIVPQREGKLSFEFSSNTGVRDYTLTGEMDLELPVLPALPIPEPSPALEITGSNNSYLAGEQVSVSQVSVLYPAIRWDARNNHSINDSVWSVGGENRPKKTDHSIDIAPADIGKTVILTNGVLPDATITIVE